MGGWPCRSRGRPLYDRQLVRAAITIAVSARRRGLVGLGLLLLAAALTLGAVTARAGGPLVTAIVDPETFPGAEKQVAFQHVRAAGATVARLILDWSTVAPNGRSRPSGFDPRDPGDPRYRFDAFDDQVRAAAAAGLQPLVDIFGAPAWAQGGAPKERPADGPDRPRPSALADFATAAAERYGGGYNDLPRVRYWQVWNEPNLSFYLVPQEVGGKAFSPGWYRAMLNAASDALHAVHPGNIVVGGGLAPYGPHTDTLVGVAPFRFMRQLLCMSAGPRPRPTCGKRVRMDAWSIHPYTSGGPTHAAGGDGASAGDLGRMNALLRAAARAGHVVSARRVQFWVTEFSWDSSPPDPKGLPLKLHARWISEVLYRMWSQGVNLVTWYLLRDQPFTPTTTSQSGLYLRGETGVASDLPKPALRAFRFPFVAFPGRDGKIFYWGRTSAGRPDTVLVEQSGQGGWRQVGAMSTNRYGIFSGRIASAASTGYLRARLANGGDASLPFGLKDVPDQYVCPFGTC